MSQSTGKGLNIAEPVSSQISGVEFGFLSPREIHQLSVKRIVSPTTFDTLLHPVPGGLYDPALGAFMDNACSTCNLDAFRCPGHPGHIDLPIEVYHPTFMDQLLRLLRAQCQYCHRLKLSKVTVNLYSCKLRLLRYGLINEASELDNLEPTKAKISKEEGEDVESDNDSEAERSDIIQKREAYVRRAIRAAGVGKKPVKKTEAIAEERRFVIKEFLADITKSRKCGNCGGISPTFRKDRYVKIFRKPLSGKDKRAMIQKGFKITAPLIEDIARQRALRAVKDKHNPDRMDIDEGVADMGGEILDDSEDGESLDADEEIVDGAGLIAEAAMTATKKRKSDEEVEGQTYVSPAEVRASLNRLFSLESEILGLVYGPRTCSKKDGRVTADMFFLQTLLVPPSKYRPEARAAGEVTEAQVNSLYKNILSSCATVSGIVREIKEGSAPEGRRPRTFDDLQAAIISVQEAVNSLVDAERSPVQGAAAKSQPPGIKQLLEKKEGMFRAKMMGKRVNFAARTVIAPDPLIQSNEIGVPPVFASKLYYCEPVSSHNYYELKEAVLNGPQKWPGAVAIEDEQGRVTNLERKNYEERQALANQLLAPSSTNVNCARNKKVYRHLNNGDVVIMNRQPSLHKPSMMVHRVRVLQGSRVLRMHYANTNSYNADFDGDEMNMHVPQNEMARAEAATIADADQQYISATAGNPLRGLIQDHISVCVALTSRDSFFTREEVHQLLYNALGEQQRSTSRLVTVPPAILKPRPMYTGKSVVSMLLLNLKPESHGGLTFTSKSQTAADRWGKGSEEGQVLFKDGELLTGVLDKKNIGSASGGFIHCIYEAYGATAAGRMLSALGRLLTFLLHMKAFSCGVEDLILTPEGEKLRRKNLEEAEKIGLDVAAKYVSLTAAKPRSDNPELLRRLELVLRDDSKQHGLDQLTNQAAAKVTSAVTSACLPAGLIKPFPKNQMQAMTGTGAKGSQVNANLISCNLGSQVLEGRRVPVMSSGKTLPSFRPFETSVRAGGYIVDRFLTGIRPQEYYFHTMAGREGLIDTAVKTSRSGYLQRCVIKGLEGARAEYDGSVRDISDGAVIQFLYGEDGLDTTKTRYLTDFKFTAENFQSVFESMGIKGQFTKLFSEEASEHNKNATKKYRKTGDLGAMDPALAVYSPTRHAGSTSEAFYSAKKKYLDDNPDKLIKDKKHKIESGLNKKTLSAALDAKYLKSLIEPGEAVGVVAGQSIGEPSTQMTLNTFHLAGHAAKNVTLGIPRLRELLMTASAHIMAPVMTAHLNEEITKSDAERFAKGISRLSLAEIIDSVQVSETLGRGVAYTQAKIYQVRLNLFPASEYCDTYAITVEDVLRCVETKLLHRLKKLIRDQLKKNRQEKTLKAAAKSDAIPEIGKASGTIEQQQSRPEAEREGGNNEDDDEEDGDGDGDATNSKQKANRSENASYENPDDDEEAIAAQNRNRDTTPDHMDEDETYGGSPKPGASDASDSESGSESQTPRRSKAAAAELEQRILSKIEDCTRFSFDAKGEWCEFTFEYDASTAKLLMLNLVEKACHDAVIQSIPGVKSALFTTEKDEKSNQDIPVVMTEGVNMLAMRDYQDVINPNKLFTNDVVSMLRLYGVEAARACLVRELSGVFAGHGISVDNRHLNLIADKMTRGGGYAAFNRIGMKSNVSPFMKMSFETTVGFLKDAVLDEDEDDLNNPSARIVLGLPSKIGTGAFDVLTPVA